MLRQLGVIINPANLQAFFPHSLDPIAKIYVFLGICHMPKLVRNTLGTGGMIIDEDGNKIIWKYFIELQMIQEVEGVGLGIKLKMAHIKWLQQKMKVNLAAQTL